VCFFFVSCVAGSSVSSRPICDAQFSDEISASVSRGSWAGGGEGGAWPASVKKKKKRKKKNKKKK